MASNQKSPLRIEAERLCKELPNAPTRTLARRLASEFGATIEQARIAIRTARGAAGSRDRKYATTKRKGNSEAAKKPKIPPTQLPESVAEDWEPFRLESSKVLVISDTHIPFHSMTALKAILEYGKKYQPDCVLLNGDVGDYYTISRWETDPRKRNLKGELDAVRQFLAHLRELFPKSRIVYKYGNHDERWEKFVWNRAPELADCEEMLLSTWLKLADLGIEWVAELRPVMAGELPIFHGHELGQGGISNPVNPARGAFLRTHHSVLVGHSHQTSGHADTNVWHNETFIWSTGCLCDLNPRYRPVNRWNWGAAKIDVDGDNFDVSNLRINREGRVRSS